MNLDYIAGLFDGEGHIKSHIYQRNGNHRGCACYIGISNNNKDVLDNIQKFLGYGSVVFNGFCSGEEHNPSYCYHIMNKKDIKHFIELIKDRVVIKREECLLALEMLEIWLTFKGGIKITDEQMLNLIDLAIEMTRYKSGKNGPKSFKIQKLEKLKSEFKGGKNL